ncbi:MAG: tetratricopeptide repeat protein [Gemmataceae bacterium]|nr:tetratricopeptide repeat protein [Gemmataceae bacterium]
MDCHRSALAALFLAGACAGCVTQPGVPGGSAEYLTSMASPKSAPPRGNGKPSAALHVAVGKLCENGALPDQPSVSDAQRQQQLDRARQAYQKAIEIDPRHADAYLALANHFAIRDDHRRAVAAYHQGLEKLPKEPALWFHLGICHCRRKEWQPALDGLKKAHELDPENREYGTQYGLCLARIGRFEEGEAVLTRVQGESRAHYNLARMADHLKQPELAKQHLRQVLQTKPDHRQAQEMLARLETPTPNEPQNNIATVGFKTAEQ